MAGEAHVQRRVDEDVAWLQVPMQNACEERRGVRQERGPGAPGRARRSSGRTGGVEVLEAAQNAVGNVLHVLRQQVKGGRDDAQQLALLRGDGEGGGVEGAWKKEKGKGKG